MHYLYIESFLVMEKVLHINTVGDYLGLRNQEVLHPLVGIVDFKDVDEGGKVIGGIDALHFKCYAPVSYTHLRAHETS